jgi:hypothetical protein
MKNLIGDIYEKVKVKLEEEKYNEFANRKYVIAYPVKTLVRLVLVDIFSILMGLSLIFSFQIPDISNVIGLFCLCIGLFYFIYHLLVAIHNKRNVYFYKDGLSIKGKELHWNEINDIHKSNSLLKGIVITIETKNNEKYIFSNTFINGNILFESYLMMKINKNLLTTAST